MKTNLTVKLTARLFAEEKCFGPGVAQLLTLVDQFHSLRSAAAHMDMAYSKAWKIVKAAEEGFGCKLLRSSAGGRGGGWGLVALVGGGGLGMEGEKRAGGGGGRNKKKKKKIEKKKKKKERKKKKKK